MNIDNLNMKMDMAGYEASDRMNFIRKVYSILATQLSITSLFIVWVQTSDDMRQFMMKNNGLAILASLMAIVFACAIICCFGRQAPINMILLFAFTVCESYSVAGLTAFYKPKITMMAGATTALATISLTIYAFKTKTNIEVFYAMAFVVYVAMLPLIIISLFVGLGALYTLYCCLGLLLYSLYLIIDTMMIVGGKPVSGKGCSMDDYVIGAMMLYLDIIMMFIYILQLFGKD